MDLEVADVRRVSMIDLTGLKNNGKSNDKTVATDINIIKYLYDIISLKPDYKPTNYKWSIGREVMRRFNAHFSDIFTQEYTITKVYGIECEIDRKNPDSIRLYELISEVKTK